MKLHGESLSAEISFCRIRQKSTNHAVSFCRNFYLPNSAERNCMASLFLPKFHSAEFGKNPLTMQSLSAEISFCRIRQKSTYHAVSFCRNFILPNSAGWNCMASLFLPKFLSAEFGRKKLHGESLSAEISFCRIQSIDLKTCKDDKCFYFMMQSTGVQL